MMLTKFKKVLVVEDDFLQRNYIRLILKQLPFEIWETANGEAAVDFIDNNEIDLIITDINLPGINGTEVIRHVRQHDQALPIIVITTMQRQEIFKMISPDQINCLMMKPLMAKAFLAYISSL